MLKIIRTSETLLMKSLVKDSVIKGARRGGRWEIKSGALKGNALKAAQGALNDVTKKYNEFSNTLESAKKQQKFFSK